MLLPRDLSGLALLLILGCFPFVTSFGAAGADPPAQVLTDTADYCAELELQVDTAIAHATVAPPPEVRTLLDDGELMCGRGEIKGGIVRLRRALIVLRRGP